MDLRSAYPYWLLDKGILATYPSLTRDIQTDVIIIGAGISGALAAWYLREAGLKIVMVDRRHVGMGSTAATTGLLQYEIDTPLAELQKRVGESNANRCYLLCNTAIAELEALCQCIPSAEFSKRPSLQYASAVKDVAGLKREYELRKKIGIDVRLLDSAEILSRFGFTKPAALLSQDGAEVNAYSLTHGLLKICQKQNLEVYDHTEIKKIRRQKKGFELITADGKKIRSKKIIIACGYESTKYLPAPVDQLHTTYAIASEPFGAQELWFKNSLIWETASPYLYLRTTKDHRILVGGKDDDFSDMSKRDKALPRKVRALERSVLKLFPHLAFKTDFQWAGLFGSTKDGLPYVGVPPRKKDFYFSLGFGGNGIVFGLIAGKIIADLILHKRNRNEKLFCFTR